MCSTILYFTILYRTILMLYSFKITPLYGNGNMLVPNLGPFWVHFGTIFGNFGPVWDHVGTGRFGCPPLKPASVTSKFRPKFSNVPWLFFDHMGVS